MARRSVQGYTEKSYFENTTYLGMLSTSDALNEGYFRHLVNFDIADTAQSLTPRKGFLSTSLANDHLYSVSKNSIVYKDRKTQKHVIYDFDVYTGYIVDISTYNLKDKLIAIEQIITDIRYKDLIDYVATLDSVVASEYSILLANEVTPITLTEIEVHIEDTNLTEHPVSDPTGIDSLEQIFYTTIGVDPGVANYEARLQAYIISYLDTKMPGNYTNVVYSNYTNILNYNAIGTYTATIDFTYDYIAAGSGSGIMTFTTIVKQVNEAPTITITDPVIKDISDFNILDYITVTDETACTIDVDQPMYESDVEYTLNITVTDSYGNYRVYTADFVTAVYGELSAASVFNGNNITFEVYSNQHTSNIQDDASINYYLVQCSINNTMYVLKLFYNENKIYIGAVTLEEHESLVTTSRNIASSQPIIPTTMQTLYTTTNRPDGHIDSFPMTYVERDGKYYLEYIERNRPYNFIPYFVLNPASYILNDTTAQWAARIDIWSTTQSNVEGLAGLSDIVYRTDWCNLSTGYRIRPTVTGTNMEDSDISNRYVEGHKYLVVVLAKEVLADITSNVGDVISTSSIASKYYNYGTTPWLTLHTTLVNTLSDITNVSEFVDALSSISDDDVELVILDVTNTYSGDLTPDVYDQLRLDITTIDGLDYYKVYSPSQFLNLYREQTLTDIEVTFKIFAGRCDYEYTYDEVLYTGRVYSTAEEIYYFVGNTDPVPVTYEDKLIPVNNEYLHSDITNFINDGVLSVPTDFIDALGFNKTGYHVDFYLHPYIPVETTELSVSDWDLTSIAWDAGPYMQTRNVQYAVQASDITTIVDTIIEDPINIRESTNWLVYDYNVLVTWNKNIVYMSEPGKFHYFTEAKKKEFNEKVIKVIEYKDILLVFTAQHLYAIHQVEETVTGTDSEGNTVTQSSFYWASHRVLYNILVDEKYADAIQIFNDYILFYSADGQMYLIKPNTMIDDDTRFTLKYFNKSANDVLQNYDVYINERLELYNKEQTITKADVSIKAIVTVNFIKLFYYVPGVITYILIYDVINNRYYVYDTVTFTDIYDTMFVESGELYITRANNQLQFTMPYEDTVDMSILSDFTKVPISCLLDTGNLNLNNHLKKRFRDLHIVFKNLSASEILYNIETHLDDIISHPYYTQELQVTELNGSTYYVTVPEQGYNDIVDFDKITDEATNTFLYALNQGLFENQNTLLDFSNIYSNKLITAKSSILGRGKVFRLKMQFISKGKFKIQRYGIIYKEGRV